jgi:hypothetical protein
MEQEVKKEESVFVNTSELIDKANKAADRLKEENDRREKLLTREESLEARRILGGKSDLQVEPVKTESPKEYKDRILRGG